MANLAILLGPFLPFTSSKLRQLLGGLYLGPTPWRLAGRLTLVPPGTALPVPSLLFEQITDKAMAQQRAKLPKRA